MLPGRQTGVLFSYSKKNGGEIMAEVLLPKTPADPGFSHAPELMSDFGITRLIDGVKLIIPLTKQELFKAFAHQEQEHYANSVKLFLGSFEDDDRLGGLTADEIIGNKDMFEEMLAGYTRNRNNYCMDSSDAAEDAILNALTVVGKVQTETEEI